MWATGMQFFLKRLQAIGVIDADLSQICNGDFSVTNVKLIK